MGLTNGPTTANRSGRRIPGGLASVTVSDVPTSTVIDYDRTYLCGRGVLRFNGERVTVGQALTPAQLASIARPEGFLSTGRIYPAPAGWTAPEPVETPVVVPVTSAQAQPGDQAQVPAAPESPVAPVETAAPLTPTEQENAAQTFAESHDGVSEASGEPGDEFEESPDDEVDDPFTS